MKEEFRLILIILDETTNSMTFVGKDLPELSKGESKERAHG